MSLYDELKESIEKTVQNYKLANEDGNYSFSEIFTLVGNAVGTFVRLLEWYGHGDGAAKKATVLHAISDLFDEVISPIDLKQVPNFLEGMVDTALKGIVMTVASGWIDTIVNIFNKTGWGSPDEPSSPRGGKPSFPPQDDPSIPDGFEPY